MGEERREKGRGEGRGERGEGRRGIKNEMVVVI